MKFYCANFLNVGFRSGIDLNMLTILDVNSQQPCGGCHAFIRHFYFRPGSKSKTSKAWPASNCTKEKLRWSPPSPSSMNDLQNIGIGAEGLLIVINYERQWVGELIFILSQETQKEKERESLWSWEIRDTSTFTYTFGLLDGIANHHLIWLVIVNHEDCCWMSKSEDEIQKF